MNNQPDAPPPALGQLLRQLKGQVLDTRDSPAPSEPGQVSALEIYELADEARHSALPRP